MRFVVVGTGGVGGYFGAQLANAGESVVFVARGEHLKALRSRGLRLETPDKELLIQPIEATDDPATIQNADVVVIAVKAWQVSEAAQAIRSIVGPETLVLPLQNGVEASSQLSDVLGSRNVLAGLCGTLSWIVGPGHIKSVGGHNFIKFGELDNRRSERVERLRQAFAGAGIKVEVPADIHKALWEKFILVTAFGGVGAISRAPIGVTRKVPETRRLLEQCIEEVVALAQRRGISMSQAAVADSLAFLDTLAPSGTTSLQRDIADGKPSELEFWNGAVVRLSTQIGLSAPLNQFIYASLLPQELQARKLLSSKSQ